MPRSLGHCPAERAVIDAVSDCFPSLYLIDRQSGMDSAAFRTINSKPSSVMRAIKPISYRLLPPVSGRLHCSRSGPTKTLTNLPNTIANCHAPPCNRMEHAASTPFGRLPAVPWASPRKRMASCRERAIFKPLSRSSVSPEYFDRKKTFSPSEKQGNWPLSINEAWPPVRNCFCPSRFYLLTKGGRRPRQRISPCAKVTFLAYRSACSSAG